MIKVSVLMITYNHENFIREAIEGVLMQKTDFPIELIIGEDCSTDGTRKIVMEYARKYPDIIRPLLPDSNLGMMKNFIETMQAATGKYIALCEGDDYWTDPYKLQKQVDFLEANEEYVICSHRYLYQDNHTNVFSKDNLESYFNDSNDASDYSFDSSKNITYWFTNTMTVLFRRDCLNLNEYKKYSYFNDNHLYYNILKCGYGYCFDFIGAVYRLHDGGVFSKKDNDYKDRMTYLIYSELSINNPDDKFLKEYANDYRHYFLYFIRKNIENRRLDIILVKDIIQYLKNEYRFENFKRVIFVLKKIALSLKYCYLNKK